MECIDRDWVDSVDYAAGLAAEAKWANLATGQIDRQNWVAERQAQAGLVRQFFDPNPTNELLPLIDKLVGEYTT
jgi:hypothetical protein